MSSIALTAFRKGSDYTICHAKTDLVDRVRPVARAAGRAGTDKLHLLPENFPPLALLESRYIYVDTSKPRRRELRFPALSPSLFLVGGSGCRPDGRRITGVWCLTKAADSNPKTNCRLAAALLFRLLPKLRTRSSPEAGTWPSRAGRY